MSIQHIFFDCDGVILNSNKIKTEAFADILTGFDPNIVTKFLNYHKANGGISRFVKFQHLYTQIIGQAASECEVLQLCEAYSEAVLDKLRHCEITPNLLALRKKTATIPWYIVSGGAQDELRTLFAEIGLAELFDGGIFGSPSSKIEIFTALLSDANIQPQNTIFLGDAKYDYEVAAQFGIPFIFVSDWSEFGDWQAYTEANHIPVIGKIQDLLEGFPQIEAYHYYD